MVDDITRDMFDIDLTIIIYEMNLVGSNPKEWWTNNGDNRHVCYDKKMFSTFEPIENGKSCSWGTLPLMKLKAKEKWSSR